MEQIEEKFNAILPALLSAVETEVREHPAAVVRAVQVHRHYVEELYRSCSLEVEEDELYAFVDAIHQQAIDAGAIGPSTSYLVPCTTSLLTMIHEFIKRRVRQRTLDRTRIVVLGTPGHSSNLADVLRRLVGDVGEGGRSLPTLITEIMDDDMPMMDEMQFERRPRKLASQVPFLVKNKRDIYRNTRGGGRRR